MEQVSGAAVTDALIDLNLGGTLTVGVDGTGHDVKFFGDTTSGQYMLWDQSTDELVLAGDSKLSFHDAAGGENIIASADGHLEINAGTTLDITAATTQVNASTLFDVNGNVDITGDLTVNGDTITFTSANSSDPIVKLINTTDDTSGAELHLRKDKGAAGADGDIVGLISFIGDDAAQQQHIFAKMEASIATAADGSEGGKLILGVATHDAEFQNGLVLQDGNAEDEIDVTIASGSSSATTVSGILGVGMAPDTGVALSISGAVGPTNGSNSAPTHTFYSDPDTGMYRSAANTIGFAAGGTEYVQIGSFGVAADTLTNKTSSGSITIDAANDLVINADGGNMVFQDGSVNVGELANYHDGSSHTSDFVVAALTSNKDILFRGLDDSTTITALKLDISDLGKALFHSGLSITSNDMPNVAAASIYHDSSNRLRITGGTAGYLFMDDTNGTTQMFLDSSGDLRVGGGNSRAPFIQGGTNDGRVEGSPGYSFMDDPNTGMFSSGDDTIAFSTGGTTALTINSSQATTFVGDIQAPGVYVGATNTSYDFYNNGTSYLNGALIVDDNITLTGGTNKLTVASDAEDVGAVDANVVIRDTRDYNVTGSGGGVTFQGEYNSGGSYTNYGAIQGVKENNTNGEYGSYMSMTTRTHGSSMVERLRLDQNGVQWGCDTQSGALINYKQQNNLSMAGTATKTITYTGLTNGFCKIRIGFSDGNLQYAHFVVELGGHMYASGNGYNATIVSNSASSMSISVTKNYASYVVAVTAGSNYAYGTHEISGGSYTGGNKVGYAFS
jgi:hypothetical protein